MSNYVNLHQENERLEKELESLRQENARLKQNIEVIKASAMPGLELPQAATNLINQLRADLRVSHSFILNFMDNWNYLRDTLSWVQPEKEDDPSKSIPEGFDECDLDTFLEAKEFSEAFAMNTFKEWFVIINQAYSLQNLDGHEAFKDIFWESKSATEEKTERLRRGRDG